MAIFRINKAADKDTTHLLHVVCPYCDLLLDEVSIPPHYNLNCPRCQATLFHNRADTLDREYALVLTGLMLFAPAVFLPIMTITPMGQMIQVSMFDGVLIFIKQGHPIVAAITFLGAIAAPFLNLFLLFLVLSCIYLDRFIKFSPLATFVVETRIAQYVKSMAAGGIRDYGVMFFRWYKEVHHWAMLEVYLIGFLITLSQVEKMSSTADAQPDYGFYAFLAVMLATVLSSLTLNTQLVWHNLDKRS